MFADRACHKAFVDIGPLEVPTGERELYATNSVATLERTDSSSTSLRPFSVPHLHARHPFFWQPLVTPRDVWDNDAEDIVARDRMIAGGRLAVRGRDVSPHG